MNMLFAYDGKIYQRRKLQDSIVNLEKAVKNTFPNLSLTLCPSDEAFMKSLVIGEPPQIILADDLGVSYSAYLHHDSNVDFTGTHGILRYLIGDTVLPGYEKKVPEKAMSNLNTGRFIVAQENIKKSSIIVIAPSAGLSNKAPLRDQLEGTNLEKHIKKIIEHPVYTVADYYNAPTYNIILNGLKEFIEK